MSVIGVTSMIGSYTERFTVPTGHGLWDWFSDNVIKPAVHFVSNNIIKPVVHVVAKIVKPVVHAVQVVVHKVVDVYHAAVRVVRHAVHRIVRAVRHVARAVVHAVSTAYHAVRRAVTKAAHAVAKVVHKVASVAKKAATATVHFVEHHAAAIASFAAGAATFVGCEALTEGIGTVGCAALAGAASNAVSYAMGCGKSPEGCSVGGAIEAVGLGAATGAVGGALGELAGPLAGKLVTSALDGALPEVAVTGLTGAVSGAAMGAGSSAINYGLSCGSTKSGCSWGGLASAAGGGAAQGALEGAAAGVAGGSAAQSARSEAAAEGGAPRQPEAGGESPATNCAATHSFVGSTAVLMADGSRKPIDQVKVGDKVVNAVPGSAVTQVHTVQKVIVTKTDHDFVDVTVQPSRLRSAALKLGVGVATAVAAVTTLASPAQASTLTTTYHHPFYDVTQAAFVDADHLKPGDELQSTGGAEAQVTSVRLYHTTTVTYDLTIDGLHTYYVLAGAAPVLVHNCDPVPNSKAGDLPFEQMAADFEGVAKVSAGTPEFSEAVTNGGRYLWTVGEGGELNMVQDLPGIHHTIASGGDPVMAAGQVTFNGGRVTSFDNWTGHYTPTPECACVFIQRGIDAFAGQGIRVPRNVITDYGGRARS
jgi:hypothetical protein